LLAAAIVLVVVLSAGGLRVSGAVARPEPWSISGGRR